MTVENWLEESIRDAERRGLTPLRPLLEALARSTAALRAADWNLNPRGDFHRPATPGTDAR